jgi:hypothetical protein
VDKAELFKALGQEYVPTHSTFKRDILTLF